MNNVQKTKVEVWQRDNEYYLIEALIGKRPDVRRGWFAKKGELDQPLEMQMDYGYLRLNATHWRYGEGAPRMAAAIGAGEFEAVKPFPCVMRWYKGYVLALFPEHAYGSPDVVHSFDSIMGWDCAQYGTIIKQSRPATSDQSFDTEYALFHRIGIDFARLKRRPAWRDPTRES